MSGNLSSCESAFVARVAAMEYPLRTSDSDLPANPILAAQQIVNTAGTLAQINERPVGSPLQQEVTLSAPMLKRNYGSLNLSKMSSSFSDSSSSSVSTPLDATFPMWDTQFAQDEGDLNEQDVSPASSASNSPMLEFSACGQFSQEFEPFGMMFKPSLGPEFVSDDEMSAYLDFMDTLEDCDSLGRFAKMVGASKVAVSNTTKVVPTLEQWRPERTVGYLLANSNSLYSSSVIKPNCVEPMTMDSLLASPNPLFDAASPRITEDAWGLQNLVFDSVPRVEVASPVVGSGSFETLQWIPTIALLVLVAKIVMSSVF